MKGILFTEILFNKTIKGEKTQTRRAGASLKAINDNPDKWEISSYGEGFTFTEVYDPYMLGSDEVTVKSNYKEGEVLYLKEPTAAYRYKQSHRGIISDHTAISYKYGQQEGHAVVLEPFPSPLIIPDKDLKWRNKLFMSSEYARYFVRITDVKLERLFDISDEDCLKEGVDLMNSIEGTKMYKNYLPNKGYDKDFFSCSFESPQNSYFSLFRFANKIPKSKELENIFCFVYDYELCDREGNQI